MEAPYAFMQDIMNDVSASSEPNVDTVAIKVERIETVPDIQMDDDENAAAEALSQLGSVTFPSKIESSPQTEELEIKPATQAIKGRPKGKTHECEFCDKTFTRKVDLNRHLVVHTGERSYPCRKCGTLFYKKQDLDKHVRQHATDFPNECKICGQQFSRASSLTNHQKIHTYTPGRAMAENSIADDEELEDILAGGSQSDIKTKINQKLPDLLPALELAAYSNMNFAALPNTGKQYSCSVCSKQFAREKAMINHVKITHGDEMSLTMPAALPASKLKHYKHACDECEKSFPTKQKLFRHSWTHRLKSYDCEQCGTLYHTQEELKIHRQTSHQANSPYTCDTCAKTFGTRQGQWEHQRSHCGNGMRFFCQKCDKQFASRQGYRIHSRTHTDDKPYGCQYCKSAFRDGGTLRKHERIHTGERPHVCPICSKAFNQKVVLRDHVRTHARAAAADADGLLVCTVCTEKFQDQDELSAHLVWHSDELAQMAKNARKQLTI